MLCEGGRALWLALCDIAISQCCASVCVLRCDLHICVIVCATMRVCVVWCVCIHDGLLVYKLCTSFSTWARIGLLLHFFQMQSVETVDPLKSLKMWPPISELQPLCVAPPVSRCVLYSDHFATTATGNLCLCWQPAKRQRPWCIHCISGKELLVSCTLSWVSLWNISSRHTEDIVVTVLIVFRVIVSF